MIKRPRGTRDVLPADAAPWQWLEGVARRLCRDFSYGEIRFPTFEATELFSRGVGDTTDVVQKEMYTFFDKDERSMTLRPEGTASVVRALLENGLYGAAMPQKFFYIIPCFRYEKPQAGRLREFHQFGVEVFGSSLPSADVEIITLAHILFERLGLKNLSLRLNSLGCPDCRKDYSAALKAYFEEKRDLLCPTCLGRLDKNPMRILDCKGQQCREATQEAPVILESICAPCAGHFDEVRRLLSAVGIDYETDPRIVRGLDYYTRTVFEFVSGDIGAQGTVCGGGRYDGLVGALGGKELPGLGFAMGLERLLLVLEAQGAPLPKPARPEIYIAPMDEAASEQAMALVFELRRAGISAETDLMGRSLKAQMKYADKQNARCSMVIGADELSRGVSIVKDMDSGGEQEVPFGTLCRYLLDRQEKRKEEC